MKIENMLQGFGCISFLFKPLDSIETRRTVTKDSSKIFHKGNCAIKSGLTNKQSSLNISIENMLQRFSYISLFECPNQNPKIL